MPDDFDSNPLFSTWEANVCAKSPPLGQWTRKVKDLKRKVDEDLEQDEADAT